MLVGDPGIKFVLITSPSHPTPDAVLRRIYEAYADHLRDPFYKAEMPIRSDKFDAELAAVVRT
jgi:trafficking protein particle complex subunit 4